MHLLYVAGLWWRCGCGRAAFSFCCGSEVRLECQLEMGIRWCPLELWVRAHARRCAWNKYSARSTHGCPSTHEPAHTQAAVLLRVAVWQSQATSAVPCQLAGRNATDKLHR